MEELTGQANWITSQFKVLDESPEESNGNPVLCIEALVYLAAIVADILA